MQELLENNSGLEAKTLFEVLQREHPGKYQDGQLRTFQRRVKQWRALHGPGNEVYFPQIYKPGQWCESDFTRMKALGIYSTTEKALHFALTTELNYSLQRLVFEVGGEV